MIAVALSTQPVALAARQRRWRLLFPAECWHLLSLDAPTVAALWAWAIGRAVHVAVSADSLALLFLGTWLLYVADRVLDGFHQDSARLRERHLFYRRHRAAALAVAVPVAGVLAWLVALHMLDRARRADLLLFALAAAYFSLVHLRGRAIERWFPKELLVALIAAAAIAVPAWSRAQGHGGVLFAAFVALFASICWLNCVAIEKWEGPAAAASRGAHIVDPTTRWGQQRLRRIGAAVAVAAVFAAGAFLGLNDTAAAALCLAGAASAALLVLLDVSHSRGGVSAFHLRIAADVALLTPLLLIVLR